MKNRDDIIEIERWVVEMLLDDSNIEYNNLIIENEKLPNERNNALLELQKDLVDKVEQILEEQ